MFAHSILLRISAALALTFLLTGCIVSKGLLFDRELAVTPFPPGDFEEQIYSNGQWMPSSDGSLTLENRVYEWDGQTFMVFDAGDGFFVAARHHKPEGEEDKEKEKFEYSLLEIEKGTVFSYESECKHLRRARTWTDIPKVDDDGNCVFSNQGSLVIELRSLARRNLPAKRYVRKKFG